VLWLWHSLPPQFTFAGPFAVQDRRFPMMY
jgi:hypothetical protein